jgi:Putative amidoligase enzyme.
MPTSFEVIRSVRPNVIGEHYGIEIEAERLPNDEYQRLREGDTFVHPLLRDAARYWSVTTDGSLRHNGVEFVSPVLPPDIVRPTLAVIPPLFEHNLVRTNVRAGVHIHVNVGDWEFPRVMQMVQTYILMEPLLFQYVGPEREQNIYCVPLYRADNEMHVLSKMFRAAASIKGRADTVQGALVRSYVRASCKYSALFSGPMQTFGTVEFRHAPTYETAEQYLQWWGLVRFVRNTVLDPHDPMSVRQLPELLRGYNFDWDRYFAEVEERGLYGRAKSLEPCTYKVKEWGKPAGAVFDPVVKRAKRPRHTEPGGVVDSGAFYEDEEPRVRPRRRAQNPFHMSARERITMEEMIRGRPLPQEETEAIAIEQVGLNARVVMADSVTGDSVTLRTNSAPTAPDFWVFVSDEVPEPPEIEDNYQYRYEEEEE